MQENINCPQCGGLLPSNFRYTKLSVCEHCSSTLFIEDDAARYAGFESVVSQVPGLVQLKQPFSYRYRDYLPVGSIRYQYTHGFWDEWWVIGNDGQGVWVSVDEGDYAFEKPIDINHALPEWSDLTLNRSISLANKQWRVTELGEAVCEGFTGELPEIMTIGERFHYAHLSEKMGGLMTLEYFPQDMKCFVGQWIDHYQIQLKQ